MANNKTEDVEMRTRELFEAARKKLDEAGIPVRADRDYPQSVYFGYRLVQIRLSTHERSNPPRVFEFDIIIRPDMTMDELFAAVDRAIEKFKEKVNELALEELNVDEDPDFHQSPATPHRAPSS